MTTPNPVPPPRPLVVLVVAELIWATQSLANTINYNKYYYYCYYYNEEDGYYSIFLLCKIQPLIIIGCVTSL